jgi:HK97 family phage major capsid protein
MTITPELRRRYARARRVANGASPRPQASTDSIRALLRRGDDLLADIRARRRAGQRPAFARAGRGMSSERRRNFDAFLRGRIRGEMIEADNTAGGFMAPPEFVDELLRNLVLFSPIREVARVANTSSGRVEIPKRTGEMTATWRGQEGEDPGSTEPNYGQAALEVGELAAYIDVSNQLIDDAALDLEAELAIDFAEEFGRAEGAAFVKGQGGREPVGLINTQEIERVDTGEATGFPTSDPADVIIDLFHALPSAYAANATWGMNRSTMATLRKFKTDDGHYLVQDGLAVGYPSTILGRPVIELPDMDDVGADALPIVFGDFTAGFRIYDRVQLSVMRDPYTVQHKGLVRFHGRRRVAGGVVRGEAFKLLRVAA